jgi:hypothetical protein
MIAGDALALLPDPDSFLWREIKSIGRFNVESLVPSVDVAYAAIYPKRPIGMLIVYYVLPDESLRPFAAIVLGPRSENRWSPVSPSITYAAAAERAQDEAWPDDAWRNWRHRRATLARLLAREGMMQQVADAYVAARDKRT